jgi:hypothetical protein
MRAVRVVRRHDGAWIVACQPCRAAIARWDAQPAAMEAARTHAWLHVAREALGDDSPEPTPASQARIDLEDDLRVYIRSGDTLETAAARAGTTASALRKRAQRHGLHDLIRQLTRNDRRAA